VDDERDPVTVVDVDDPPSPKKPERTTAAQLLAAIRALPDAVAERLDGQAPQADGAPEVTFVGDPIPQTPPAAPPASSPAAQPDAAVQRPAFHHPSRRRVRTEAIV